MYRYFLAVLVTTIPALAGEYAVLNTGFRIHAERHQVTAGSVFLYTREGGVTELPKDLVKSFDAEDSLPPAPVEISPLSALAPLPPADSKNLLHDAALRAGLPPALVESVARIESNFRPEAVSPKGALGVMQLMPETARSLAADPRDSFQNIDAGARLLRELLLKYDGDVVKALAAYNAGEAAVDRYRGIPPYRETQDYIYKVVRAYLKAGGK